MRRIFVCLIVLAVCACDRVPEPTQTAPPPDQPAVKSLAISGTTFRTADGDRFEWRGITAFRLAELLAAGREREVVAYLDWAKSERLTVLRVLLMAQHLFQLPPERGVAVLPQLLDLARARGVFVEVVALADTQGMTFDLASHVREVGKIAAEKGNAFVEIANEPGHPTQDPRVHDPAFVAALAALVPDAVPVSFGSVEYGDGYAAGDYVTFHSPRGAGEWDHVTRLVEGARLIERFGKPVISDEPMGAGPEYQQGRRDNDPRRFAAAAAVTRLAGLGATFHYEGGLQARIPRELEARCFAAWTSGLALIPTGVADNGPFLTEIGQVAQVEGARRAYARAGDTRAAVLLIDPREGSTVQWSNGWSERASTNVPGVQLRLAAR